MALSKQLTIYYTSDSHAVIFPNQEIDGAAGLLQCASGYLKDGNTLVLDGGDTIHGSAMSTFLWESGLFEQTIPAAFNAAGYDCYTLGNHDFNSGYEGLRRFNSSMDALCLAANVTDLGGGLNIAPYVIKTMENGLRVGITGIVTDYVNLWEPDEHLQQVEVSDAFAAVKAALAELAGQCDLTVCIYHGGYENDIAAGRRLCESGENTALRICEELELDLLLTAHQHSETAGCLINGTYTLQLPPNAAKYARLSLDWDNGRVEVSSQLVDASNNPPIPLMDSLLPVQAQFDRWRAAAVGTLARDIPALGKLESALNGSPLADLCNMVQLNLTGADISCTGLSNRVVGLASEVTVGDIFSVYPFLNTTMVLEVDRHTLLLALERCASYFDRTDGTVCISKAFTHPKQEHYNYDYFAGVCYTVDLAQPVGQRVRDVIVNGEPLCDRPYRLALSNYRATGTGGYDFYAKLKPVYESAEDIREVIIRYLKEHPSLDVQQLSAINIC